MWGGLGTDRVLVPAVVLEIDGVPGLGMDEGAEVGAGHYVGLAGFAVLAGRAGGELGEEPHAGERDAGAEAGGRFGYETAAAGAEDSVDLAEDGLLAGDDEEEAGDDDCVDGGSGVEQGLGVSVGEGAVAEAAAGGAGAGTLYQAAGEIDPGSVDVGVVLGETAGVEAGSAAEFEDARAGAGAFAGEERTGDLLGVVAEEVLAAEGVEPGATFEEAVRRVRRRIGRRVGQGAVRILTIAWIHALNLALVVSVVVDQRGYDVSRSGERLGDPCSVVKVTSML
jgi:hypothetical protein